MADRYESYEKLKFDRPAECILRITFSQPGKLNALDAAAHEELTYVWRDVEQDSDTSCVILTGADDVFSAGGDLGMVEQIIDDFEYRARAWKEARDLVYNVINCSKPIVSAMAGPAVGAGLAAGLLADISIAVARRPGSSTGTRAWG